VLWEWGRIQGDDVFKVSSLVEVHSTSREIATKNLKPVTVSTDNHRKVNQKGNNQSHPKHHSKFLQMAAIPGKYLLEAMYCM